MNEAHLHLVVNHFPIILLIVGILILIGGLLAKSEAVNRTAYLVIIFGALSSIAAMTSGGGAEEIVENINGITKNYIERHEEAAETFSILSYILGGVSVLGLWASFTNKSFSKIVAGITIIFAVVTLFFAQKTGTTGGEIRHTEIRSDYQAPATNSINETDDDD
ncbi:MAG: hypothetical protein K0B15_13280 [Lentimicrobium sp.]|nr:hypothetical protein [Lentimicrobium sp.]